MIRNINYIFIQDLDDALLFWKTLPLVPASASADIKTEPDDKGLRRTLSLNATLKGLIPELYANLRIKIRWSDGSLESFGSEALPLRLSVTRANPIRVSASYVDYIPL